MLINLLREIFFSLAKAHFSNEIFSDKYDDKIDVLKIRWYYR